MSSRSRKARPGAGPPEGESWVWHSLTLLESPAWRARSLDCIRFLEFLEIEHLRHAGTENGMLAATYNQLVAFGIRRHRIRTATNEAEQLGLITRDALPDDDRMLRYQMTYLPMKKRDGFGAVFWEPPTDQCAGSRKNEPAKLSPR
jgi:hypothetical protein